MLAATCEDCGRNKALRTMEMQIPHVKHIVANNRYLAISSMSFIWCILAASKSAALPFDLTNALCQRAQQPRCIARTRPQASILAHSYITAAEGAVLLLITEVQGGALGGRGGMASVCLLPLPPSCFVAGPCAFAFPCNKRPSPVPNLQDSVFVCKIFCSVVL